MDIVLVNDTSGTNNPGCKGTIFGLLDGLRASDCRIVSRLPIGYAYRQFNGALPTVPCKGLSRITRKLRKTWGSMGESHKDTPGMAHSKSIDNSERSAAQWRKNVDDIANHLRPLWQACELVVINGEGTIHHDSLGALTIVGLVAAAKQLGKRVALVNCSIYDLSDFLLEAVRDSADLVAAREPLSWRYLRDHGINARQAADCLFLTDSPASGESVEHAPNRVRNTPYVVYTPGVLSGAGVVRADVVADDIRCLLGTGRDVYYFVVEAEDELLARVAVSHGGRVVPLGGMDWMRVTEFFRAADLVVSGRYHINIFAALAGIPFIPMATNTPKMQGVLELLSPDVAVKVRSWGQCGQSPEMLDLGSAFTAPPEAVARCAILARNNFVSR